MERNCILRASRLSRSVILFKLSTDRVLNYIQNTFSSHVGLMHTSLQLCDVGRAVCGLYFREQEIEVLTGCFLCLSQWLGPGLLLLLLLGFFPFLFVMDPEELFVREHSLLSRSWVLSTEFTHIITSRGSGGIQAHRSRTPQVRHCFPLCLGFSFNCQQSSLISPVCLEEEGHPICPYRQKPRPGIESGVSRNGQLESNLAHGKSQSEGIKQALFLFLADLEGHNLKVG